MELSKIDQMHGLLDPIESYSRMRFLFRFLALQLLYF